jgi:hypothetical protein
LNEQRFFFCKVLLDFKSQQQQQQQQQRSHGLPVSFPFLSFPMSSVVVSGDSSDGASSEATGGEGNPIELDDSSTNSNSENEIPPAPIIFKREGNCGDADHDDDNGDENERVRDDDDDDDENEGDDNESGENGDEEFSEGNGDDEIMNTDTAGRTTMDESAEEDESENENKSDDDDNDGNDDDVNNDDDGDSEDATATKGSKDASIKDGRRLKKRKEIWGNIESMSEIVKSPYDGNECAEVGEDSFEEFRLLMDRSETNGKINPRMVALVGDKLARDLCNAHHEIGKSGMLYSANWKEGKIRESDFGWIPKRQLLLCLHEHRFAKGDVIVLQAVTKNLDCTKLVLEAMKLWDLMDAYPNLASNKNEETFAFGVQKVFCYRCQIFVARAFATLQILNKTDGIQQSLTKKIKACLGIMNEHVRVNQIELARMRRKAKKRTALQAPPCSQEQPDVDISMDLKSPYSKRSKHSGIRAKATAAASTRGPKPKGPGVTSGAKKPTRKRRRKVPKREEREESIFMLFNTMHMQVQRLNQMMSFFQSQLQDHRGILREEIRENLEKDGNAKP